MSVMLEPSVRESKNIKQGRSGRGGGGVVIYQYARKKFIQIYPTSMEALYTVYLKFKESDIPITCI